MTQGHIYFIMGVSGSGKGTLIKNLAKQDNLHLHIPPSYKTREIRSGEVNGIDAHFVSHEDFRSAIENEEFLEYAILYDGTDYYGTKYEDVLENGIEKGYKVVKEIDINGLKRLKKERPALSENYTTIFLHIPANMLKERIDTRGSEMIQEEFERRLLTATQESVDAKNLCSHIIDATQSPESVLEEVLSIMHK